MKKDLELQLLIDRMRTIQRLFSDVHGVNDIWSNSKIYEVLIANTLNHFMIPGHSGSLDARDQEGKEYEYKHFKASSSNHSWTFNDFSDTTIAKLKSEVEQVVFAFVDDTEYPPKFRWAYQVDGQDVSHYLTIHTQAIANNRRMINLSANQIEKRIGVERTNYSNSIVGGRYSKELTEIFTVVLEIEKIVGVENILTSNKFWEVLVSLPLGHTVNSEQGGRAGAHDAYDDEGNDFEYKVSSSRSWSFQDISSAVLTKYLKCESIVLAVVDKTKIEVKEIWVADAAKTVNRLRKKLDEKENRYKKQGKEIRRQQITLGSGELQAIAAKRIL
jgi:hypothetical protein